MQSRRSFCAGVCQAALVGGAVGVAPGCGGGGGGSGSPTNPSIPTAPNLTVVSATIAGNVVTVTIGATSPLANVGGLALVQAGTTSLLVARTSATTFNALTATCTHEQCLIIGGQNDRFVCPCHGSTFDLSGRVLVGPAVTALRSFATSFAGTTLTITL